MMSSKLKQPELNVKHLTIRDHFAGLAMQALLTTYDGNSCSLIAIEAYQIADAMLAEKEEKKNER